MIVIQWCSGNNRTSWSRLPPSDLRGRSCGQQPHACLCSGGYLKVLDTNKDIIWFIFVSWFYIWMLIYMKVLDTICNIFLLRWPQRLSCSREKQCGCPREVPLSGELGELAVWTGAAVWWTAKLELVNLGNCQPVWKDGWSLIRGPVVLWNLVLFQNSFLSGNFSCGSF